VLAGGVPLWAVSSLVVFPPTVFGGCAPSGSLSRVAASFHVFVLCVLWRPGAWPTSRPTTTPKQGRYPPRLRCVRYVVRVCVCCVSERLGSC